MSHHASQNNDEPPLTVHLKWDTTEIDSIVEELNQMQAEAWSTPGNVIEWPIISPKQLWNLIDIDIEKPVAFPATEMSAKLKQSERLLAFLTAIRAGNLEDAARIVG